MDREDAELLHEQMLLLLMDEKSFGDKLVNDRKIKLSLVTLLVGFGVFQIESASELATVASRAGIPDVVVWVTAVVVGLLLAAAVFLLVLERNPAWIQSLLTEISSDLNSKKARDGGEETDPKKLFGAAFVVLHPDDELIDQVAEAGYEQIADRLVDLSEAYVRLAHANRRVRRRLEHGTFCLLLVFVCVIILSAGAVGMSIHDRGAERSSVPSQEGSHDGET